MKKILLTACLSAALCAPAMADDSGFRMGVGYTFTKAEVDVLGLSTSYGDGIKWELGYDFNRFLSITASYETNKGDTDIVEVAGTPGDPGATPPVPATPDQFYQADGKTLKTGVELGYGFEFNSDIQNGYVRPYLSAGYLYYEEDTIDSDTFYYGVGIHFQGDSGAYINVSYDFASLDKFNVSGLGSVNTSDIDLSQGSVVFGYRF
ncbi:hypothetical protein VST7929_00472 [Vibrio stylophorae]|uniref:Outer membrane protein beta-barrel domain-containing protein n=1 Tax=Vibrio stylophorae TaxID=659351 RepID=A0ABN8DTA4_9VIBR|nr:porin family protein [Vibrio stylophorae]CAH0532632.1 hypothetical protein VST7929_00472 [Vibrio stylophorae]